ncbi:MAG: hypothetical protein LBI49_24540 [Nocardiopsaceae bacterium]|jgi:hypothetical protein|nr:hypothetical protein [Nocardiopsaceae bacterium]
MRGGKVLVVLAGIAVLAAGCGTEVAHGTSVATAVTRTGARTARIAITTGARTQGMSFSFTQTGVFDFARDRGMLSLRGPAGMAQEVRFLPPRTYLKLSTGAHGPLPHGKSWVSFKAAPGNGPGAAMFGPAGSTDPGDMLAALRAVSSGVTKLGSDVIRGVRVTHFRVSVDPAKAAARVPRSHRPGFEAFAHGLGAGTIPVDVWVDQHELVRQVRISLHPHHGQGIPAAAGVTQTIDFWDFGVPVRVSPPPAAEIAGGSRFMSGAAGRAHSGLRPPPVSGALSPAQAAAAGQAVRALWTALGSNDRQAAARAVLPAQRRCLRPVMGRLRFTVRALRIVSARPAGTGRATVRFTVKAHIRIGGHSVPMLPEGPGRVQWLVSAESGGHWYVDLAASHGLPVAGC